MSNQLEPVGVVSAAKISSVSIAIRNGKSGTKLYVYGEGVEDISRKVEGLFNRVDQSSPVREMFEQSKPLERKDQYKEEKLSAKKDKEANKFSRNEYMRAWRAANKKKYSSRRKARKL